MPSRGVGLLFAPVVFDDCVCTCAVFHDHDYGLYVCCCGRVTAYMNMGMYFQADNKLGAEGAKSLAPELGKLTQLQTLNLSGE